MLAQCFCFFVLIHNIEHYVQPHYGLVNNIMFISGKDSKYPQIINPG